ncbi:MAG TPA: OmpA family protein [Bryobacteraceae bacterium]|jgi:peptidoglycan-associated lipoprotein
MTRTRELTLIGIAILSLTVAGCAKKKVAQQPTTTPTPTQTAQTTPTPTRSQPPAATPSQPTPSQPTSRYPDAATRARIDQLLARIEDAYFDYDKHTLRPDAVKALEGDSRELRDIIVQYPDYKLTIEGHCDERGSAEYNMQLGQARAESAKNYLVQVGIPSAQLNTISYGKEKPACEEHDEACWQKNRRIHIVAMATK